MRFILFTILLYGSAAMVTAAGQTVTDLKMIQSKHLSIYTTGEFKNSAPILIEAGEAFLKNIEARWAIKLPDERFSVTLARNDRIVYPHNHIQGPEWLAATYNRKNKRVELMLRSEYSKEDLTEVVDSMNHLLLHRLLDMHSENKLPLFLEEGIAQYYGSEGFENDMSLVIWGFNRHPSLEHFLLREQSFQDRFEFFYAAAISKRFVSWLWDSNPGAEVPFIQKHLSNRPLDLIYEDFSWDSDQKLVQSFHQVTADRYTWFYFVTTYDFWLIVVSLIAWSWFMYHVVKAFLTARMGFVEEEESFGEVPDAVAFKGPAFDPTMAAPKKIRPDITENTTPLPETNEPIQMTLPPIPPDKPPISMPSPPPLPMDISPPPRPNHHGVSLPQRPQARDKHTGEEEFTGDLGNALDDVEEGLDAFFDEIIADPKQKKAQNPDEMEADLDQIFDNWQE